MRSVKKWSSYCHCRWREPTHATPSVRVRRTACSTKRRKKFAHLCLCDAGSGNAGKKIFSWRTGGAAVIADTASCCWRAVPAYVLERHA